MQHSSSLCKSGMQKSTCMQKNHRTAYNNEFCISRFVVDLYGDFKSSIIFSRHCSSSMCCTVSEGFGSRLLPTKLPVRVMENLHVQRWSKYYCNLGTKLRTVHVINCRTGTTSSSFIKLREIPKKIISWSTCRFSYTKRDLCKIIGQVEEAKENEWSQMVEKWWH